MQAYSPKPSHSAAKWSGCIATASASPILRQTGRRAAAPAEGQGAVHSRRRRDSVRARAVARHDGLRCRQATASRSARAMSRTSRRKCGPMRSPASRFSGTGSAIAGATAAKPDHRRPPPAVAARQDSAGELAGGIHDRPARSAACARPSDRAGTRASRSASRICAGPLISAETLREAGVLPKTEENASPANGAGED